VKKHETAAFNEFDKLLLEAIDESFTSLGEVISAKIYLFLEQDFGIKKQEISENLEEFSGALKLIFGLGAMHLEIMIMKAFHKKMKKEHTWNGPYWLVPDLTLQSYIEMKKQNPKQENEVSFWVNVEQEKDQPVNFKQTRIIQKR
jgi:hypothetical protein